MAQIRPVRAERIADVLVRARSVSVEREGNALNPDTCHLHGFVSMDA